MRGRTLWSQLLRIGMASAWRSSGGRLRQIALISAAAVMTATLMSCLMVLAVYDGWDRRESARGAELARNNNTPAIALYKWSGDAVGTVPHSVISIEPLSSSASPPPGLPRWPEPGEAFLSPELIREGVDEHITTRYGTLAGVIGKEGLASPGERLAYVRPKLDAHRGWFKIARFGSPHAQPVGDSLNRVPAGQFLGALALTLGGTALVLLVIAVRTGSVARDRRTHLLAALGGNRWHRALVNVGEALPPTILGTALGVLPYLVMMTVTTRLPISGFVLDPADLRVWAWSVPLAALIACAVVFLAVVMLHRISLDGRTTRPRTFAARVPVWRLMAGLAGLTLVVITPYLPKVMSFLGYIGGTALLWGMLPSAAGVVVRWSGARLAEFGLRTGQGAALVAGRWAQARPGVVVRLVAVVVIGLGVITQAQVWTSRLGDTGQNAKRLEQQLHDSVMMVAAPSMTSAQISVFRGLLPKTSSLMAVRTSGDPERPPELHASCPVFRQIGLTCPVLTSNLSEGDVRAQILAGTVGYMTGEVSLREGDVLRSERPVDQLVVVSPLGSDGLDWKVKAAANRAFGMARVDRPFDGFLLGADRLATMAAWVRLLTVLTLAILLVAVALSSAAEFLVFTVAVAPLTVLSERKRLPLGIAMVNLTLPTMLAVVIGVVVAAWQGKFFVAMSRSGTFSWEILGASAVAATVLAVVIGLAGGVGALRAARHWRPTAD
ncbi:hypothetical protein [Microtetraspora fusca]|uniref:hypothetical protein n=1 Tax=Microtetraspora fusca TaxID=1997 RepID=UPI000829EF2A|nr:hypothetical protein [Microtetraspora fusca]